MPKTACTARPAISKIRRKTSLGLRRKAGADQITQICSPARSITIGAAAFVAGCAATSPPSSRLPDPLAAGWAGQAVCERLLEDQQQRILRCTFPPGVGHERHFHAAHFGYCLSGGTMQITDADGVREVQLATGSHYQSSGTDWHEVLNVGDTTVAYLLIEPKN